MSHGKCWGLEFQWTATRVVQHTYRSTGRDAQWIRHLWRHIKHRCALWFILVNRITRSSSPRRILRKNDSIIHMILLFSWLSLIHEFINLQLDLSYIFLLSHSLIQLIQWIKGPIQSHTCNAPFPCNVALATSDVKREHLELIDR